MRQDLGRRRNLLLAGIEPERPASVGLTRNGSGSVGFLLAGTIALWQSFQGRWMKKRFKLHDCVSWNSEAGRVSGRIVKVHTKDVNYKGYVHHASKDEPQYEIKSDKTDHVALHKGTALRLMRR
jgi:hypothetical protein